MKSAEDLHTKYISEAQSIIAKFLRFSGQGSRLLDREADIYFFHILINVETDITAWKWIFYQATRSFITMPGMFEPENLPNMRFHHPEVDWGTGEARCEATEDCVAVVRTAGLHTVTLLDYVDLDAFTPAQNRTTLVKVKGANSDSKIDGKNAWEELDLCCPAHTKVDRRATINAVQDALPRISCDLAIETFRLHPSTSMAISVACNTMCCNIMGGIAYSR